MNKIDKIKNLEAARVLLISAREIQGRNMNFFKKIYHNKYFPRLFYVKPDGGKESGVTGYFLIELKALFSIGLLHFKQGSRENFHSHAFFGITWWFKGSVTEEKLNGETKDFGPSFLPKFTPRTNIHRVISHSDTWAVTFRGPWEDIWYEYCPKDNKFIYLTHGRKEVEE